MSFLSPTEPIYINPTNSSSFSDFDFDKSYYDLLRNPKPDYDELLIHLSVFSFNQLSHDDRRQKVEEISHTLNVVEYIEISKESDEATRPEAFAELLKKLSYSDQLKIFLSEVIQKFIKLGRQGTNSDDPDNWLGVQSDNDQEQGDSISKKRTSSDPTYSFEEFFLGFSVIWFEGQSTRGQEILVQQLEKPTRRAVIVKFREEETQQEFKQRKFKELCMMGVVDFKVQEQFLTIAEVKLRKWGHDDCRTRLIGEPQDRGSAAELLSHLWSFGVSLMSKEDQELKIDEMSTVSCCTFIMQLLFKLRSMAAENDYSGSEATRIERLTDLFNQNPIPSRIALFKEMRTTSRRRQKRHSHPYDEEFMSGLATNWFKAKCANMQRNPVQLILFGRAEIGDTIQKQPEESEENFRLRRFEESFKQLDFTSKNLILDYIEDTLLSDLSYIRPEEIEHRRPEEIEHRLPSSAPMPQEGTALFDLSWINYRPTNPRNLVAATAPAAATSNR